MQYYIGIDGGGTKTEFLLADERERVLARVLKGGSNPNDIGIEKTCAVLKEGIEEIAGDIPKTDLHIFAGISGAGVGENAERLSELLKQDYPSAKVTSDLMNAIEICLGNKDGLAVICGTGISCSIVQGGIYKTVGGYGYLFEDGGSGYAYGRDALKAVLRYEDGFGAQTVLTKRVHEKLGDTVRNSLGKILLGGKATVASFAPLVFEGNTACDGVCEQIIERNLDCTVTLVKDALTVAANVKNVSFMGGITKEKLFREKINETFENKYKIYFCEEQPVYGALRLAIKGAKK